MPYENSEAIFKEIAAVTPSYKGITWERIANLQGAEDFSMQLNIPRRLNCRMKNTPIF